MTRVCYLSFFVQRIGVNELFLCGYFLVEDEKQLALSLKRGLKEEGHVIEVMMMEKKLNFKD